MDDLGLLTACTEAQHAPVAAEVVRQALVDVIGAERYGMFFGPEVEFNSSDGSTLEVRTPTLLERNLLRDRFGAELAVVFRRLTHEAGRVVFRASDEQLAPAKKAPVRARSALRSKPVRGETPIDQRRLDWDTRSAAAPTSSLADFLTGTSNLAAVRVAEQIISRRPTGSPVVFWGPTGVGKSHLLRAIRNAARQRDRRLRVLALTGEQFTTGFVEALQGRGLPSFRQKHRGVELLLVDDLQFFLGKKKTAEEFQYTLDHLTEAGAVVVCTCDRPLAELAGLGDELLSRLRAGLAVEISSPEGALRRALTMRIAAERGLELTAAASDALASTITGGAREITGAINRLQTHAEILGAACDETTVLAAVEEINRTSAPNVQLADVEQAVCEVYGVAATELKGTTRKKAAAEPRMLAMWLARKHTRAAWSEIGAHFGRRSHSTVIAAHHRVEELIATGPSGQLVHSIRRVEQVLRKA